MRILINLSKTKFKITKTQVLESSFGPLGNESSLSLDMEISEEQLRASIIQSNGQASSSPPQLSPLGEPSGFLPEIIPPPAKPLVAPKLPDEEVDVDLLKTFMKAPQLFDPVKTDKYPEIDTLKLMGLVTLEAKAQNQVLGTITDAGRSFLSSLR